MDVFILSLLNGISFGSILFLFASGLSLIMGVMGILNLSHGALYMVGAYVGWTIMVHYKLNFGLALLSGGLAAGLIALAIESSVMQNILAVISPYIFTVLVFTVLYITVPNCKVKFIHAISGAAIAALLFQLTKFGFTFYITNFPTYKLLYGALAVIPIFLRKKLLDNLIYTEKPNPE